MCSDLLLTNTIISLLLWDNEVASVLFPLPSAILNKDVPTSADVTVDGRSSVPRSSEVTECVIPAGVFCQHELWYKVLETPSNYGGVVDIENDYCMLLQQFGGGSVCAPVRQCVYLPCTYGCAHL